METRRSQRTTEHLPFLSLTNNYGVFKNTSCNTGNTQSEKYENCKSSVVVTVPDSRKFLVWRTPWWVALAFFSTFCFLWVYAVVIKNYWIDERFEFTLPGLAKSALRKHSIRLHMTFGALALLCSFIQMVTPYTSGWKRGENSLETRNFYRQIHRYTGRIYVMSAIMAFFFGQWFIILKEFILVGGYNMGVSFSLFGFVLAYFAYMTWKTAPSKNADSTYTIEDHRNYAIRSFSQIIAPILYRYWYTILIFLKIYRTPYDYGGDANKGEKLICDDRDICQDYLRPFDALHCWLYWIGAWAVAEMIIVSLPRHQAEVIVNEAFVQGDETKTSLLKTFDPKEEEVSLTDSSTMEDGIFQEVNSSKHIITNDYENDDAITPVIAIVGCILAVLAAIGATPILFLFVSEIVRR